MNATNDLFSMTKQEKAAASECLHSADQAYSNVFGKRRITHTSAFTENPCIRWVCQSPAFHHDIPPRTLGVKNVSAFLDHLATRKKVLGSTRNQTLNAIVFPVPTRSGKRAWGI